MDTWDKRFLYIYNRPCLVAMVIAFTPDTIVKDTLNIPESYLPSLATSCENMASKPEQIMEKARKFQIFLSGCLNLSEQANWPHESHHDVTDVVEISGKSQPPVTVLYCKHADWCELIGRHGLSFQTFENYKQLSWIQFITNEQVKLVSYQRG